jgi:hypothetical protein
MKSLLYRISLSLLTLLLCLVSPADGADRKPLTPDQQKSFLGKRTSGGMMGSFDSYCSLLYALHDVAIHTESQDVNQTRLESPFPDFYKPTWQELFDAIARQTKSSCKYDATRDYWVFNAPPQPLPFEIKLAKGWQAHDEGLYMGYQPEIAPVGMDIYMLGHYSGTNANEQAKLFGQVREAIALRFAKNFKSDVSVGDMSEIPIGDLKALHFKADSSSGIIWRQWIVMDSGNAFAIVSAIKPEHEKDILPGVEAMVKSFKPVKVKPKNE